MSIDSTQIASRLGEKIADLLAKRSVHLAAVADVEGQLKKAFQALGLDPSEFGIHDGTSRLPQKSNASRYPLDPNTMGAHMMNILLAADKGYARLDLRKEIEKEPRFAMQIGKNVNGYYNMINRYLSKGRIVDVGGLIYHPDRAPLPEGEDDATGAHLAPNVTLFSDRKRSIDLGD